MTTLREAVQQAIALICSARLCEVNSMSSRQEMLRLMIEATDTLRAALAEHDKKIVWVEERKAHWAEQLQLARETQERERQQREEAALAEPVQEPVAWIQPDHLQKARRAPFLCRVEPTKRMVDFVALYIAPPQRPTEPVQEPVAWSGYDLDAMVEAFDRVIEAHFSKAHPFHDPTNMDAKMALRILRGLIPAMKAYTAPPQRKPLTEEEIIKVARKVLEHPIEDGKPAALQLAVGVARAVERAHDIT